MRADSNAVEAAITDWFRILSDLRRCRMSFRLIAELVDADQHMLYRAWRGSCDLRHAVGQRVIRLWAERTARTPDDAPQLPDDLAGSRNS